MTALIRLRLPLESRPVCFRSSSGVCELRKNVVESLEMHRRESRGLDFSRISEAAYPLWCSWAWGRDGMPKGPCQLQFREFRMKQPPQSPVLCQKSKIEKPGFFCWAETMFRCPWGQLPSLTLAFLHTCSCRFSGNGVTWHQRMFRRDDNAKTDIWGLENLLSCWQWAWGSVQ